MRSGDGGRPSDARAGSGRIEALHPKGPAGPAQGPGRRFEAVVLPHLDAAYSFARFMMRDPARAEDVAQEAVLKAWRGFSAYAGGDGKAWLLAIVRRCALDALQAANVVGGTWAFADAGDEAVAQALDEGDTPEAALMRKDVVCVVRESISRLPEPFREALILRELEELSYKEIAAASGVPVGTVMSRLARARAMLGEMLLGGAAEATR